jgi:heterodisulfide reductase subunit B
MSKLGYFPGCSLERSADEYDCSSRIVCRQLGIELVELPDWSCCGAHAAHHTQHLLATGLSARNLDIAAAQGLDNIVAPCPACYNRLKSAQAELADDPRLKERLKTEFDINSDGRLGVFSLLEWLSRVEPERIKAQVKVNLGELKVVAYYGCLLVRPPKLTQFDDPENPGSMDTLLGLVGVQALPWDYKVQCCGAALGIGEPEVQLKLSGDILQMAQLAGAEAVAVACPLCHANLDLKQKQINRRFNSKFNLPIFYFTQLLGLAFGASPGELGVDKHMIDTGPLLAKLGIK